MNIEDSSTNTRKLLAELAPVIIKYGSDSQEVIDFMQKHSDNQEFVELANVARDLRKGFIGK